MRIGTICDEAPRLEADICFLRYMAADNGKMITAVGIWPNMPPITYYPRLAKNCATLVKSPSAAGDYAAGDREWAPRRSHNHDDSSRRTVNMVRGYSLYDAPDN